jgi:hypothetical protein
VQQGSHRTDADVIDGIDSLHARVSAAHRDLLCEIVEASRRELWRDAGARDLAHWLCMRLGISAWKASRWIACAHALEHLPRVSQALASGALGIDKVAELTRFATRESESGLIGWAKTVSGACIRRRADLAVRESLQAAQDAERARCLNWWWLDDGKRFGLSAELPAAQGAVVAKALERAAESLPVMPGEDDACHAEARRADALVALCSAPIAEDADADRATVVVHAPLERLVRGEGSFELEAGGVIHSATVERLLCNARVHTVIEDDKANPVRIGRTFREPPAWMLRQLRYRDRECSFPGCGARQFTQAHHVTWWSRGGHTDLHNLVLVCSFHHKLVHEHRWRIGRDQNGAIRWLRPDGRAHRAGPGPPIESFQRRSTERDATLAAAGF